MEMILSAAELYAHTYTSASGELLDALEADTLSNHPKAHMISGKVQGQFLRFISQCVRPKRVLELGTFTGYSALCLAAGLGEEGKLHTIELREADAHTAQSYFSRSEKADQILLHCGNALDIIPTLEEEWDLVFIDADKVHYSDYYQLIFPRVRPGGVILADNVLFHGEVLEEPVKGKNAKALAAFNEMVAADDRVEQVLLTLRDGLMLIRKK